MRRWTLVPLVLATFGAALLIGASAPAAATSNEPLRLSFDKSLVAPGVWQGSVSGDIDGALTTRLLSLDVSRPIWHVTFDFTVAAGDSSFTTRLSGVLSTETGAVVMDGTVVRGYLLAARVHEEGQLIDPATLRFVGTIRLMPATAA
jgi:hypothetical protein